MASRGINKVILIGNLGADPEIRSTSNGNTIANLRLATSETWKDQQGQQQERTEWHRVVLFGRTAEVAQTYLRKGSKLFIEGRLQTRKWQDKEGRDQYSTEIVANDMQMLDRAGEGQGGEQVPGRTQTQPNPQPQVQPTSQPVPNENAWADFDDDVPF